MLRFLLVLITFISLGLSYGMDEANKISPDVKRMMDEQCRKEYSVTCLKLDMASLVPSLSVARKYRLLPGLTLEAGGFETKEPGGKLPLESVEPTLDRYLIKGLDSFMNSISIRIKVMDKAVTERIHNISQSLANKVENEGEDVGRGNIYKYDNLILQMGKMISGRRKRINALMMGGMVSAGTLLALTMSAISAMAGKAILLSLLSLALTMMGNRGTGSSAGGSGGGGKTATYEIITHTVPHHDDYTNRHWGQDLAEGYHIVKAAPQT